MKHNYIDEDELLINKLLEDKGNNMVEGTIMKEVCKLSHRKQHIE